MLRREAIGKGPALVLAALVIACFVPALDHLEDGKMIAGRVLLVLAWLFGMLGLYSVKSIRDRWRWGALAAILMGGALWVTDYLVARSAISGSPALGQAGRPHAVVAEDRDRSAPQPEGREEPRRVRSVRPAAPTGMALSKPIVAAPSTPQRAPLVASGGKVTQKNVNGPNVIAGGNVTINPEVNPYAPVVTYDFNGAKRVSKSGGSDQQVTAGEAFQAFQKMESLRSAHSWRPLAELCETEIRSAPGWLTPYLYAGEAYVNLAERKKAIERLRYVEKHAGGNQDYAGSTRLLEQLRGLAKPSAPRH